MVYSSTSTSTSQSVRSRRRCGGAAKSALSFLTEARGGRLIGTDTQQLLSENVDIETTVPLCRTVEGNITRKIGELSLILHIEYVGTIFLILRIS